MENTQNKKLDLTKPNVSRQFFRKKHDGSLTRGYGFWEDMAEPKTWEFVEQLLHRYQWDEDVALSNDLSCVIEKEDDWDMEKFVGYHPQYEGYTIEQLKKELEKVDAQLYQEAEDYLQEAINNGEIELREFPVTIVSAKPKQWSNIMLQPVNKYYRRHTYPNGFAFRPEEFQLVESRIIDGQFQVRNFRKDDLQEQWMIATMNDFENLPASHVMTKEELAACIKKGEHPQFIFDKRKQTVTCRCGEEAIWLRNGYLCPTITAYPCEYNKQPTKEIP